MFIHWAQFEAKLQCRNKGLCSIEDPNMNISLSRKIEALTVSEPQGVVQLKKKEDIKIVDNNKIRNVGR